MSVSGFDLSRFQEEPVLGILRGVTAESLNGVMEASIAAGLRFIEVTLNTENAPRLIESSVKHYSQSLCVGAGTVLSPEDAKRAVDSGAQFLVAPGLNEEVTAYCREQGIPFFPGALTPTEIEKAWRLGAVMVKVFPANLFGPNYFRLVKGPFQDMRLLAVGGVGPANVAEYLAAGADAVAIGGSIFSYNRMQNKEFSVIQKEVEDFLLAVRNFYSKLPKRTLTGSSSTSKG